VEELPRHTNAETEPLDRCRAKKIVRTATAPAISMAAMRANLPMTSAIWCAVTRAVVAAQTATYRAVYKLHKTLPRVAHVA
jgi:hypothetical protein